MLGYRDSGMADSEPNDHPDCFHQADVDEATGRLVAIIRRTKPQVIITYNDDQAGLPAPRSPPRPRHLGARVRTGRRPVPGIRSPVSRSSRSKLYYSTWSRRRMVAMHEGLLRHRGESPFDDKWFERPDTDHRVTTRIEVGDYMWARTESLLAHATQVDPTAAFWFGLTDERARRDLPVGGLDPRPLDWSDAIPDRRRRRARSVRRASISMPRSVVSVQYRVVVAKKDERVDGPDDAEIVVTVPVAVAAAADFDATVEFMRGRLKATGHSGEVLDLLKSGDATTAISRLASQSLTRRGSRSASRPTSCDRCRERRFAGDEGVVVDPLLGVLGQWRGPPACRSPVGRAVRSRRAGVTTARRMTRSRDPARQSWSKWSGKTTPSSAASWRNGKPGLRGRHRRRQPDRQLELAGERRGRSRRTRDAA